MAKAKKTEALPVIAQPRLPYHPGIEERFKIDKSRWKALVEAIYPTAESTDTVILALSYCKAKGYDPFKRCIHIVPVWDKKQRKMVDTVWPSITELRITAHRTKQYSGKDATRWGPDKEGKWSCKPDKGKAYEVNLVFPEWAQITVYRTIEGVRCAFSGPIVYWLESYASLKDKSPNSMWQKRPRGQLEKCAEAAALRLAFPEEIGNEYIDAEAHVPEGPKQIDSFDVTQEKATAELESTTGSKPVTIPEPTQDSPPEEAEPTGYTCTRKECGAKITEKPMEKRGKLQCPQCLNMTMVPDGVDDFMED
jgi:phage recombination protein Bet